jgi:hypothetical protein
MTNFFPHTWPGGRGSLAGVEVVGCDKPSD